MRGMNSLPQGPVLSPEIGLLRPYGRNPCAGYDDANSSLTGARKLPVSCPPS